MPSPLQAAGAVSEPSEYAPIGMDRAITGLWTQRSPLRDAAVPYLQAKFYSASRFDSLIDGINREVTARLTTARRPGSSIYNSQTWNPINSFYAFKWLQGGAETIQIIVDQQGGIFADTVCDATGPTTQTTLFTKSTKAKERFASIGNALYFCDGNNAKKYLQPGLTWTGATSYSVGNFIRDPNGNIQEVAAVLAVANIQAIQVLTILGISYVQVTLVAPSPFSPGLGAFHSITFAGLTAATFLNGQTLSNITEVGPVTIQVQPFTHAAYGPATDTGAVSGYTYEPGNSGNSGGSAPTWNVAPGGQTVDGDILWRNCGSGVFDWGVISPVTPPTVGPATTGDNRFWTPNATLSTAFYSVLDSNGNVQVLYSTGTTGPQAPRWNATEGGLTPDGTVLWSNAGRPSLGWAAATVYVNGTVILDSNGNLELVTSASGTSGATVPTWNATIGGTTTDGPITWTNIGTGSQLATATFGYAYAWHAIDGSVTNASPITTVIGGVLGSAAAGLRITLSGDGPGSDLQYDEIWIYRILQGGSTLLLLDTIPSTGGFPWAYIDTFQDSELEPFIQAPIALENNPPPAGATAPTIHLGRAWISVGGILYYSTGPDTNGGSNGYTAFNPSNNIPLPELILRTDSVTLNAGPALLVWTTTNVRIITGNGTAANPFIPGMFMPKVGILSYDEVDVVGSTFYLFTTARKAVSIDPSAGYVEVGFPIGDQFIKVTTGGLDAALFNPGKGYVTWHEKNSGDTGMYYCDGATGWFRLSPVSSPESGFLWSPIAVIEGGTSAVQSVETTVGANSLLIGPSDSGPILRRDTNTNADNNVNYDDSYIVIGNIELAQSGEIAEIAHICLDSMAIGGKATVGLLLGEIAATTAVPFDMLEVTSADPENLPAAQTLYNDRYTAMQNGICPKCRHFQLLIQYPSQNEPDELLAHTIYGAKHSERRQQ